MKDLFNITALDYTVVKGHEAIAKLIKDSQAISNHLEGNVVCGHMAIAGMWPPH